MSTTTTPTRLGHLETAVATLASQFTDFIADSKAHRERIERDQAAIWGAVKDQGDRFTAAVDRISTRGTLSWPIIVITIGMILTFIVALATVAEKIVDAKLQQHAIRAEFVEKALDDAQRRIDRLEAVKP